MQVPEPGGLTAEEETLIKYWRGLPAASQYMLLELARLQAAIVIPRNNVVPMPVARRAR